MRLFLAQLKWQFILLQRNYLITISVVMTAIYALIFYAIKDLGNADKLLTLLIYNDPAVIGLFFVGLSLILDKNQEVLSALFVTPVNLHTFLICRIIALSLIGGLCGLGMAFFALGFQFHFVHFFIGVTMNCLFFTLVGVWMVSYTTEFLPFVLRTIPILLTMSLPFLNYFEITDLFIFKLLPVQGSLTLMINSYREEPIFSELIFGYVSMSVWIPLLYIVAYKMFLKKIVYV